jgi:peptide/nickel transport system substrate-binding protein
MLSGCHRPARQQSQAVGTITGGTQLQAAPTVTFPDPGPFQTVEVKNADGTTLEALQARGEVGKFGGLFKVCTFGAGPKTFNPWAAGDVESNGIGYLQFERLVELDAWSGKIYPRLAKSFSISHDNRQYTFVLRKGLQWSDGQPITADDVVFTFDKLVRNGYGESSLSERDTLTVYKEFPRIEKLDDLTVRFTTKVPFGPFLNSLRFPIAPKHVLAPIVAKRGQEQFSTFWDINNDNKSSPLVCSGPFILDYYKPGERVVLKRNPHYFMVDRQLKRLPYLDGFVVAVVPDQNTILVKFYAGDIDFLDVRSVRGNDVALMKQRERHGDFSMYNLGPDDGTVFLMFNMNRRNNDKGKPYVDRIKQRWFNNDYFRQAVSHAIDRRRIVDNALRGVGLPLYTSETPAAIFFNKDLKAYDQNLSLAADLLKKGGFEKKGDRLYDDQGHPVEFTLLTNAGNTTRDAICVSIKNELQKLGMKVNYQPIEFNILIDKTSQSLDWEAIVMGLSGNKVEPYDGANVWKSDGRMHMFDQRLPDSKGNVTVTDARDWEKAIDDCFDKAATTLGTEQRRPFWNKYQQIAYEKLPFIYIETMLDITAMRNTVGNYKPTPLGIAYTPMGSLHNVEEIYFKNAKP